MDYQLLKEEDGYIIPEHYKGKSYQSIEIIRKVLTKNQFLGFTSGLAIKYLTRITENNRERNLKKAKYYIDESINYLSSIGEVIDNSRIHPDYYKKDNLETIDIIEDQLDDFSYLEGFYIGVILKYLFRFPKKHGLEDLVKAKYFIERYLNNIEGIKNNNREEYESYRKSLQEKEKKS